MSIKSKPSIIFKGSIKHIAKHFKVIRLAFGCSLDEIAANLGYTRNTVSKYEDPTYIWKPHDYYALRCMFELLAFSIQDTEYYLEIWCRLIEGMTYKDYICVSEKYIDKLAVRILELAQNYPKKKGLADLSEVIKKTLITEGHFELKEEDLVVS